MATLLVQGLRGRHSAVIQGVGVDSQMLVSRQVLPSFTFCTFLHLCTPLYTSLYLCTPLYTSVHLFYTSFLFLSTMHGSRNCQCELCIHDAVDLHLFWPILSGSEAKPRGLARPQIDVFSGAGRRGQNSVLSILIDR